MKALYRLAALEKRQTAPRLIVDRFERDLAQQRTDKAALLVIGVALVSILLAGLGVLP